MKNIYTIVIAFLLVGTAFSQNEIIIRINDANQDHYDYFNKNHDEITAFQTGKYLDVLVNQERYNDLKSLGWEMQITQTAERNIQNLNGTKDIAGYHTYDEALAILQEVANDYPDICTLTDIADSHGKEYFNSGVAGFEDYQHDIWMLKISDNVNESEDEPAVFFVGAHHAREPISTEVVLGIIEHLTSNYGIDDEITNMVDNAEIYIIPMVNPDGHEVVLDQLNTMWRKNVADGDGNGQFNYNSGSVDGVDPNRNYGWNWGGDGSSGDQTAETYRGPSAFSEPETAVIRDLMDSKHFTSGITYHSYSELVLYPYGYSSTALAPDHFALEELAVDMAESIPKIIGSGHYFPEQSNDLYPASGVTDDWAYGNHGIFSFTVELGQEFIPPSPQVPAIVSDNIEAAMLVLNRANQQTLRGHVYDAETLEPLVAEIFIDGIDNSSASFRESYKSDAEYGAYYRLLMSGDVDASFSAYGYISQSFETIEIVSDEATILDVYLDRAAAGPIMGSVLDGITGEDIEGASIEILNTPVEVAYTNENGVYSIEEISYSTYTIRVSKDGFAPLYIDQSINENHHILNFVLLPSEAITYEEGIFGDEFSMSGNQNWVIDDNVSYEGDYSAASGSIGDNQSSSMLLTVEDRAEGSIRFYHKVSSESGYDFLSFYVDGIEQHKWSGELAWTQSEFQISEGDHVFKWTYAKDGNTIGGSDKSWVDFIEIPPVLTTVVNAGPDQDICHTELSVLSAFAANYSSIGWTSNGDGTFSADDILDPIYTPGSNDISSGSVELSITVIGLETVTDQLLVNIETCIGINQLDRASGFSLSPNPVNKLLTINIDNIGGNTIEIYNVSGILMHRIELSDTQKEYQFNAASLPAGVYLVKLNSSNGTNSIKRLLVQ